MGLTPAQRLSGVTSTTPTAGSTALGSSSATKSTYTGDYGALINKGVQQLGLKPDDPSSLGKLSDWLNQNGVNASVIQGPNGPSDHKLYINGAAWTAISSDNYQPGTYRWDPYQQVASPGNWDPTTGAPVGSTSSTGAPTSSTPTAGTALFSTTTALGSSGPVMAALQAAQRAGRVSTIGGGFTKIGAPMTRMPKAIGS